MTTKEKIRRHQAFAQAQHKEAMAATGRIAIGMNVLESYLERLLGYYLGDIIAVRAVCRDKTAGWIIGLLKEQIKTSPRFKNFTHEIKSYVAEVQSLNEHRNNVIHRHVAINDATYVEVVTRKDGKETIDMVDVQSLLADIYKAQKRGLALIQEIVAKCDDEDLPRGIKR